MGFVLKRLVLGEICLIVVLVVGNGIVLDVGVIYKNRIRLVLILR